MPEGTCSIDTCDSPYGKLRYGWCQKHYRRWKATGDPLKLRPRRRPLTAEQRFWRRIVPDPETGCWMWQLKPQPTGYGTFNNDQRRPEHAHHFAYRLLKGPIGKGLHVDHTCHNEDPSCKGGSTCPHRMCCNPAHLVLATPRENVLRGVGPSAVNARKTHCGQGHPLSGDNLIASIRDGRPRRACRACHRGWSRDYRRRQHEKARAGGS